MVYRRHTGNNLWLNTFNSLMKSGSVVIHIIDKTENTTNNNYLQRN